MSARTRPILLATVLLLPLIAQAEADWSGCRNLSFDPLGANVPSCTRLVEDPSLTDAQRADALSSRAEAYLWALTYRHDHEVTDEWLQARALADVERAVALVREANTADTSRLENLLAQRATSRRMSGDFAGALEDYGEALSTSGDQAAHLLESRAAVYSALGRHADAIADMTAAIRIAPRSARSNLHNWIFQRGTMYEAAGNLEAAVADYRHALEVDPQHHAARQALQRLRPDTDP